MSSGKLPAAIALKRVLEGALPLQPPNLWHETFRKMIVPHDGQLRFVGLASMLGGLIILLASHSHA
ncbi:hypothetical protein TPL01_09080 [Sulfuriferula plumbiphila]|uniref:DUF2065 domain-containing protein n=1 Tax=Sulfuriferula plumbiphila TaxID=171865 RepID=A0A512L5M1_9PROT|nr:DUF2065 domain-containing protein [Sulfuriferula plumbiphila]BBP03459.1 hypothetical protein SFPGR_08810 [Sulfuriferula plumbiphila]GEP29770.1 hypothetical protein TPL01_09080 [Sulfuriferula plumbiphila]